MKRIHKICAFFMIMFVALSELSVSTYANTVDKYAGLKFSNDNIDKSLITDAMLEELRDGGEIVSISEKKFTLDGGGKLHEIKDDTLQANMPRFDFNLIIAVQRVHKGQNLYEPKSHNFKIVASGQWIASPLYEFTDCIGIAWSDNFTLKLSSAYIRRGSQKDITSTRLNTVSPERGVAYNADLKLGKSDDEILLTAYIYKKKGRGVFGSANAVASYGHVILAPSFINVGFSYMNGHPGISMSTNIVQRLLTATPAYASFNY